MHRFLSMNSVKKVSGYFESADGRFSATRFYASRGDAFSGWVVQSTTDRSLYTDPLPNRQRAEEVMKSMVAKKS